jgi:serine protease
MMKNLILIAFLWCCGYCSSQAQNPYYWTAGKKHELQADSSQWIIFFDNQIVNTSLLSQSFKEQYPKMGTIEERISWSGSKYLIISKLANKDLATFHQYLKKLPNYAYASPLYLFEGKTITPTPQIVVKPKPNVDLAAAIAQIAPNQLKIKEKTDWNMHLLEVTDIKEVFNIANALHESGLVTWAHPNFHGGESTDNGDPYYYMYQFYINSELSNGMHLNVESAWYWVQNCNSNPKIRVAVMDDGFEPHEDLRNMDRGYSPNNPNEYGAINDPRSRHGISCAGMIGAQHNTIGIKGINPNVSLVPINIWENNTFVSTFHIAKAFLWASREGNIDVISNSWQIPPAQAVADAIQVARTQGRNGKGCSVVFSTGNRELLSEAILFPANQPGVVTVGGLLRNGDLFGLSLAGPELDVMAFADEVATTDRMGELGYSNGTNRPLQDPNYINTFRGTSAAAPQVAAIASLVLQANPNLTEAQVLQIIQETATDMGPAGRDDRYGHGRANANKAVMKAMGFRFNLPSGVDFGTWFGSAMY